MTRARLARIVATVVALGSMTSLVWTLPALATTYYYGEAELDGQHFDGAQITIRSNVLSVPDTSTQHNVNRLWVVSDNTSSCPSLCWVEAGISIGKLVQLDTSTPVFSWADQRPNGGGYHDHQLYGGTPSMNTYHGFH